MTGDQLLKQKLEWVKTSDPLHPLRTKAEGKELRLRIGDFPDVLGTFPAALMAEEITTPGKGQLRTLFVSAGNPVLSVPNGRALAEALPELDLFDRDWPIWTYAEIVPPAKFVHDEEGRRGEAISSLVSGGCIVSGATARRSLLCTGVHLHSFARIEGAVLLPYVDVGRGARLTNVVIDRGVRIPDGLVIGEDPEEDALRFRRTDKGICLVTQAMLDKLGA